MSSSPYSESLSILKDGDGAISYGTSLAELQTVPQIDVSNAVAIYHESLSKVQQESVYSVGISDLQVPKANSGCRIDSNDTKAQEGAVKLADMRGAVDWQTMFMVAYEMPAFTDKSRAQRRNAVRELATAFYHTAEAIIKAIVLKDPAFVPIDVGGIAGGTKYIAQSIFVKRPVDEHGLYGDDMFAAKAASHEVTSLNRILCCRQNAISFPLLCTVDVLGVRMSASTLVPISDNTLCYGSQDGARTVLGDDDLPSEQYRTAVANVAEYLHLHPHTVNNKKVQLAVDVEGHVGSSDGRFYLIDTARTFPPTVPSLHFSMRSVPLCLSSSCPLLSLDDPSITSLSTPHTTRVSAIERQIKTHLSCSSLKSAKLTLGRAIIYWSADATTERNERANALLNESNKAKYGEVFGEAIIVVMFGIKGEFLHELFRSEHLQTLRKLSLPRLSSDAFSRFGSVDAQKHNGNVSAAFDLLMNTIIPATAQQLDSDFASSLDGQIVDGNINVVDWKGALHHLGINMRFLMHVRSHVKSDSVKDFMMLEVLARTVKNYIKYEWRCAGLSFEEIDPKTKHPLKRVTALLSILNNLLGLNGCDENKSKMLWSVILKQWIEALFPSPSGSGFADFSDIRDSLSRLSSAVIRITLHERISKMLGIVWETSVIDAVTNNTRLLESNDILDFSTNTKTLAGFNDTDYAPILEKDSAIRFYEERLATQRSVMGENHPSLALTLINQAECFYLCEDEHKAGFARAKKTFEEAVELSIGTALEGLIVSKYASFLQSHGDAAGAVPVLERAITALETQYRNQGQTGPLAIPLIDCLISATASRMLSGVVLAPQEQESCIANIKRAKELISTRADIDQREMSSFLEVQEARLLMLQGKLDESIQLISGAIEIITKRVQLRGDYSAQAYLLSAIEVKGTIFLKTGNYDEAYEAFMKVAEQWRVMEEGRDCVGIANGMTNAASALQLLGKQKQIDMAGNNQLAPQAHQEFMALQQQALQLYSQALQMKQSLKLTSDLATAVTLYNIGTLEFTLGMQEQGLNHLAQCLQLRQVLLPPNHPDIAAVAVSIAKVYHIMGKAAEALQTVQAAYSMLVQSVGAAHQLTQEAAALVQTFQQSNATHNPGTDIHAQLSNEAVALCQQKDWAGAAAKYAQAIQHQPNNPLTMYNLGCCYGYLNNVTESVAWMSKAFNLSRAYGAHVTQMLAKELKTEQGEAFAQIMANPSIRPFLQ